MGVLVGMDLDTINTNTDTDIVRPMGALGTMPRKMDTDTGMDMGMGGMVDSRC